ncbi:hypothetical protein [Novacetimonas hansenii]|uniref:glycine-rich domain-containing protein n=1 Tax=Novacetimonas hansenii TaxID=436 RepID=UPI00248E56EC|nr:hypothetical protein [Novacetimonas hansenii]
MKQSSFPAKFALPFAGSAGASYIRTIPQASQVGVTAGAASLTDGFPPVTFDPVSAGGTPPSGADMNGILNWITSVLRVYQAGYFGSWDGDFATAIGGYPLNAIVSGAVAGAYYISTVDDNMTTPGASGASWQSLFTGLAPSSALALETTRAEAAEAVLSTDVSLASSSLYPVSASTTVAVPSGVTRVYLRGIGAGAGATGCSATTTSQTFSGAGGGSGGIMEGIYTVTPGDHLVFTIGSGGAGNTSSGNGYRGGQTSCVNGAGQTLQWLPSGFAGQVASVTNTAGGGGAPAGTSDMSGTFRNDCGNCGLDGQSGALQLSGSGGVGPGGVGGARSGDLGGVSGAAPGAGGGGAYDSGFTGNSYAGGNGASGKFYYKWLP